MGNSFWRTGQISKFQYLPMTHGHCKNSRSYTMHAFVSPKWLNLSSFFSLWTVAFKILTDFQNSHFWPTLQKSRIAHSRNSTHTLISTTSGGNHAYLHSTGNAIFNFKSSNKPNVSIGIITKFNRTSTHGPFLQVCCHVWKCCGQRVLVYITPKSPVTGKR